MKKTKIIATVGPATEPLVQLKKLSAAGVDIFRLNFSHGTYEWFGNVIKRIQLINETREIKHSIMLDTKGPEIRTSGDMEPLKVIKGKKYTMAPIGTPCDIPVSYGKIVEDCKKGQLIQLDSGKVQAKVWKQEKDHLIITLLNSGTLTSKRHVNLPGVHADLPILGSQDKEDIAFGIQAGINLIAASFVNTAEDIEIVREEIKKHTDRFIPIIAKIESQTALNNIDAIMNAADAIMIARGDLGVEIPYYKLATVQQELIEKSIRAQKPIIMATQMLASMVHEPTPTRAEITDVANAVSHQTDCIMLSDETTVGKYTVSCIEVMKNIAKEVEKHNHTMTHEFFDKKIQSTEEALLVEGVNFAESIRAKAIMLVSDQKDLIRKLATLRPTTPLLLITTKEDLAYYGTLMKGMSSIVVSPETFKNQEDALATGKEILLRRKMLRAKDHFVTFLHRNEHVQLLDTLQVRSL